MPELWQPIEGYEGLYEVSDHGRVRSLERTIYFEDGRVRKYRSKILKPIFDGNYFHVGLCCNSRKFVVRTHRLVAVAFLGAPADVIDHINGNKLNNCVSNLEWVTQAENLRRSRERLRRLRAA